MALNLASSFLDQPEQDEVTPQPTQAPKPKLAGTTQTVPQLQAPQSSTQPTQKPQQQAGGAPSLSVGGASVDPLAFTPLTAPITSSAMVAPQNETRLDAPLVDPPPPPEVRMGPTDKPFVNPVPTTPSVMPDRDAFDALYGDEAAERRAAFTGDPTNDAAVWAAFTGGPEAVAAAKQRYNAYSRDKGYGQVEDDAIANMEGMEAAGGLFSDTPLPAGMSLGGQSLIDHQNGQTRQQFIDTGIRRAGYDPVTKQFIAEPENTVNGQVMPADDDLMTMTGGSPSLVPSGGAPTGGGGVSRTPIDPNNSLLQSEIRRGPGLDRFKLASDALENYKRGSQSAFDAALRDSNRYAFGSGRGVSGMARTSRGDLVDERMTDLDTRGFQFLNDALTGTIDDTFRDIGIAQQQQGFQKDLSDTAFNQERELALLEDLLTNSAFGRALSQQNAGYANSPESWDAFLASIFGDQASGAANAAARAFAQAGRGSGGEGGGFSLDWLWDLLDRDGGTRTSGAEDIDYGGSVPV